MTGEELARLKPGDTVWIRAYGGGERKARVREVVKRGDRAVSIRVSGESVPVAAAGVLRKA